MRRLRMDGSIYSRECIAEAAKAFSGRAEIKLPRAWSSRPALTLRSLDKTPFPELEAEFFDEALSCLYRGAAAAFNEGVAAPVLAAAAAGGFRPPADEFLARMEPDVARDRRLEVEALMEKAGALEDAVG